MVTGFKAQSKQHGAGHNLHNLLSPMCRAYSRHQLSPLSLIGHIDLFTGIFTQLSQGSWVLNIHPTAIQTHNRLTLATASWSLKEGSGALSTDGSEEKNASERKLLYKRKQEKENNMVRVDCKCSAPCGSRRELDLRGTGLEFMYLELSCSLC